MTPAVDMLVDIGATARLTVLVMDDTITIPARDWIAGKAADGDPRAEWLDSMLACPWCTSLWVGLGVVAARRLFPNLWPRLAVALTASAVTGAWRDQH